MPLLCYVGSFSYTTLLFYVGCFSYTPHAVLYGEFLLHAPCCFMSVVSLTRTVLFCVGRFSYTSLAGLCGEIVFHAPSCFMWGVSLDASFSDEFPLHSSSWF